jgi:hypothetical protein
MSVFSLAQNFKRVPLEKMVSSPRKIEFRDIVVSSKGDMIITASMGFAAVIGGHQFEYQFTMGGLENNDGKVDNPATLPNIFKDVYYLHTGLKSIAAGPNETIYAVSDNNNFGLIDLKIGRGFTTPPFNFSNKAEIGSIWIDNEGDLFIAVKDSFYIVGDAINIFESGNKKLSYETGFDKDSNFVITKGGKSVKGYSLGKNIKPTCFLDISDGEVFIGTDHGIYELDKKTGLSYNLFEKMNDKQVTITSIVASNESSEIWFGTLEMGLGVYNTFTRTINFHPYRQNLPNPISKVVRISQNELLVAVVDSLPAIFNIEASRYEFIDDTSFSKGKNSTTDIKVGSGKSMALVLNGDVYLSGDFLKNRKVNQDYPAGPYIKDISVNGAPYSDLSNYFGRIDSLKSIRLKYYEDNVDIIYAPRGISTSDTVIFAWKMDGKWEDWMEVPFSLMEDRINMGGSKNLNPGTYIFRAKMKKAGGDWLKDEIKLTIIIDPPFWQTIWFWTIIIVTLSLFLYFFTKWRVRVARRYEREKSRHEKELLELEARALRAQMNPHFIFNCMNSIKALIQNDEKQKSIDYLTTFSKLIRTLFNNSDKRQISLYDELETCKLYTQLEAMRLEGKLDYRFEINENLDLKSVMVPALIIQPFIENAIWHGIVPKEKGIVIIRVTGDEGSIVCEVEDDGIGRELSMQNKPITPVMHQSKGINLSQSRLNLEKVLSEKNASVSIVDNYNHGQASGTSVFINFTLL